MGATVKQRVIRYVRPTNKWGKRDNLGGVTLVFDMDYTDRKVAVRFSVCSKNENFDKKTGLAVAEKSEAEVFDLDAYRSRANHFGGFAPYYTQYLDVKPKLTKREKILVNSLPTL